MLQNLVKHCKNKNELEALALSANNPRAIFFTTDTNSIILGGKIFGIGNSLLFIGTQSEYNEAILAGQIPYGTIVIIEDSYLTFTALGDNCSIGFYNNPDATISPTIEYSFDKNNWSVLTNNVSIEKGREMYCRGINPDGINSGYDNMYELGGYYNYFTGEGLFNVSGDIMSLINYETPPKTMVGTFCNLFGGNGASPRDNFVDIVDASKLVLSAKTLTNGCYANMFFGCTSLTTAPEVLPATTLTPDCYMYMFAFCPFLTTAPVLPATKLADMCYAFMFYCTSLTTAPELPATELAMGCYGYMFAGCISLTDAPSLHATELADACDAYMFVECISLTTVTEILPATELSIGCYSGMFSYCESLLNAPELPATTLTPDCYSGMFEGCTSLTVAPALPATELADYCYMYMFEGCTSLTGAPALPATTLTNNCYESMFSGCTALTAAPELPATTLIDYCYSNMFDDCISLTDVPTLPATELADYCYSYMFQNCTSLITAPTLPATTLDDWCYYGMFQNCTSLITAPTLPATVLSSGCYSYMFEGCTALTAAPELPATKLVDSCYMYMFASCTSLTAAPLLIAATLVDYCYHNMFYGCTKLNYIKCLATTIPYYCTDNWVYGVSSEGTFVKHPDTDDWSRDSSGIPSSWTVENALISYVTFTAELDGSSIGLNKLSTNQTLEYSTNTTTWNKFDTTTNITLNKGDKVYVRGVLKANNTSSNYTQFKMSGKIAASDNCNAIWNYQDLDAPLKTLCGYYMFYGCTSLTTAPALPATTLADSCYSNMFYGCTSLTTAPEILPATTLARSCYAHMFRLCTSLTTAPELPATELADYCYSYMFSNCTNLKRIKCLTTNISAIDCMRSWVDGVSSNGIFFKHPDMNDWTVGTSGIPSGWNISDTSYVTFTAEEDGSSVGLEKLSTNQTLEYITDTATAWNTFDTTTNITLNKGDKVYVRGILSADNTPSNYTKFDIDGIIAASGNCNAIWNYQDLNAPLKAYCGYYMFYCLNLVTAPELPATTLTEGCYSSMFDGCMRLTTAPELPATTLADSCYSNMFQSCSSLTAAPELPATELTNYCYKYMFSYCTYLTAAPELPATTLAKECYYSMFGGCNRLNYIKCLATDISAKYCTNIWVHGVSSTGTFVKYPGMNNWTNGNSGIPIGWTIEDMSYVIFTAKLDGSSIGLERLSTNQTMEYSTDTNTWNTFDTTTNITLNNGDKVYVRGTLSADNTDFNYTKFKMTGKIAASGNCNAIWNYENLEAPLKAYCGYSMFDSCTSLTTAPDLSATILVDACYANMFYKCTSLAIAPSLPATTIAKCCYTHMFYGCTSLTTAPSLPATELADYCYSGMFWNCTSLTIAPELPATTLTTECYNTMFYGCTSLTTAPELPATELADYCYSYMFSNCTNLNHIKCLAVDISAIDCTCSWVDGVSSNGIFFKHPDTNDWTVGTSGIPSGWTIVDISYVTFTAEEDGSSVGLEKLCTNQTMEYSTDTNTWNTFDTTTNITLNKGDKVYVRGILSGVINIVSNYTQFKMSGKIAASDNCNAIWNYQDLNAPLKAYCGYNMFKNCTSLTTAPKLPATTLAGGCYSNMFYGCSSLTTAPALPAITLAINCYYYMFYGCSSLTTAPVLPAAILTNGCYYGMFKGCTKLNYIKCLATDVSASDCTYNWIWGVSSTGTFFKHIDNNGWTTGIHGIPTGWTVKCAYTPQECVKLEITADNVPGRKTNTIIYYTATTNGINDNGDRAEGKIITGTATSNEFEQNTSYTDTIERTITFEFMGVTATTTITQGVWKDRLCDVVLNNQWRLSETQSNPDSTLYGGVYESFSNKGINNDTATMYLDLYEYTEFDVYIRSYAEIGYDYVTISEPNSTTEKASTKGKQNSGQDISSYTKVHYDNLTGEDRITITYIKDGSGEGGNDQGYILIPKQ